MGNDVDKQKYVQQVKDLYETKSGKKISDAEALDIFENLVTLVNAIYQPIPKNYAKWESYRSKVWWPETLCEL